MLLYCTAGISHFLLYPNGDLYRCMAYYNSKAKPIGNLSSDNFDVKEDLKTCEFPKCYVACDLNWTYKWMLNDAGNIVKKFYPRILDYKTLAFDVRVLKEQEFSYNFKSDIAHIVWMPTLNCNYNCLYCGCSKDINGIANDFSSSNPELSLDKWLDIFEKKIFSKFKFIIFGVSGGEPFLYKSFPALLEKIAKKAYVNVTTNASVDLINIVKSNDLRPHNPNTCRGVSFHLSWHPLVKKANFDSFLKQAIFLKENGFLGGINFVTHPKQHKLINRYKKAFEKNNITFMLLTWCGQDNEGNQSHQLENVNIADPRNVTPPSIDIVNMLHEGKNDNEITILGSPSEYFSGIPFIFRLKIKNSYLDKLMSKPENRNNLLLGCKIFYLKNKREKVKIIEPRQELSNLNRNGYIEADFLINSKPLGLGKHEFRFDIVNENNFWFEDMGFKPAIIHIEILEAPYKAKVDIDDYKNLRLKVNSEHALEIKIKNMGTLSWTQEEKFGDDFKLGCRLIDKEGVVRLEYRAKFQSSIRPKDEIAEKINIQIPALAQGRYELKFDIVNENKFWFEDLGSLPYSVFVDIVEDPT